MMMMMMMMMILRIRGDTTCEPDSSLSSSTPKETRSSSSGSSGTMSVPPSPRLPSAPSSPKPWSSKNSHLTLQVPFSPKRGSNQGSALGKSSTLISSPPHTSGKADASPRGSSPNQPSGGLSLVSECVEVEARSAPTTPLSSARSSPNRSPDIKVKR